MDMHIFIPPKMLLLDVVNLKSIKRYVLSKYDIFTLAKFKSFDHAYFPLDSIVINIFGYQNSLLKIIMKN